MKEIPPLAAEEDYYDSSDDYEEDDYETDDEEDSGGGLNRGLEKAITIGGFIVGALIICVLGGCFLALSQLSPALQRLALLTPQGLALQSAGGALLVLGGVLFGLWNLLDWRK